MHFIIKFTGGAVNFFPEAEILLKRFAQSFIAVKTHKAVEIAAAQIYIHAGKIQSGSIFDLITPRQFFPEECPVQVDERYLRPRLSGRGCVEQKVTDVAITVADIVPVHDPRTAGYLFYQR